MTMYAISSGKQAGGGVRIWRGLEAPGHEWARLRRRGEDHVLRGTAIFVEEGIPGRLDYRILCDAGWVTRGAVLLGWVGEEKVERRIGRDQEGRWRMDGQDMPALDGCVDLDLSFSPVTNMLPLFRLGPAIGTEIEVRAAWLRYPVLNLVPLVHRFRPLGGGRIAYAADTGFACELTVDEEGWVVDYPPFWTRE